MDADADTVVFEAPAHFRFYKSGKIERLHRPPILPAGVDEATGVTSKDVVLDVTPASVRLTSKLQDPSAKLPVRLLPRRLLPHRVGRPPPRTTTTSTPSPRRPASSPCPSTTAWPRSTAPAAYDDSWAALQWAASAQDDWIREHGMRHGLACSSPATARGPTSSTTCS
ncbi:hypothetical protein ZWY2020_038442 [Hordeum vulgare]|nr:hypothetical protein ZWY2020_038442 [Hordeum vulgare]